MEGEISSATLMSCAKNFAIFEETQSNAVSESTDQTQNFLRSLC